MDSKECIGDGGNADDFIVVKQAVNDLCERVCGLTGFNFISNGSNWINSEKPCATKEIVGGVKLMVTPYEDGHSDIPSSSIINEAFNNGMGCDNCANSDVLIDKSKNYSSYEGSHYNHENNNAKLCAGKKQSPIKPHCNFDNTLDEGQYVSPESKFYGHTTKTYADSEEIGHECHQKTIKNGQDQVNENQVVNNLSDCNNQNPINSVISEHMEKNVFSDNEQFSCQSQPSLATSSDPQEGINNFLFDLNVVKQDLTQMQMSSEIAGDTLPNNNMHQDLIEEDTKSSETSSTSSSDISTDESDSER